MRCGGRPERKPFTDLRSATGIKLLSGPNKAPAKSPGRQVGAQTTGNQIERNHWDTLRHGILGKTENWGFNVCFVFRGKLASEYVAIWCLNKGSENADTEFIFWAFFPSCSLKRWHSHHHVYLGFIWLFSQSAPLIPPLSPPSYRSVSHIVQRFSFFFSGKPLAGGRKRTLCLFLLLWRFKLVIRLMQSRPATCPGHRKPPPTTTELLSLRTKTQSLCF